MKLRYTPRAKVDLQELKQYITTNLHNPSAAIHIVTIILKSCSNLKEQPNSGIELSKKIDRETDLRYLITGKYIVFYRIESNYISIIRILDSRTSYMKVLLETEI